MPVRTPDEVVRLLAELRGAPLTGFDRGMAMPTPGPTPLFDRGMAMPAGPPPFFDRGMSMPTPGSLPTWMRGMDDWGALGMGGLGPSDMLRSPEPQVTRDWESMRDTPLFAPGSSGEASNLALPRGYIARPNIGAGGKPMDSKATMADMPPRRRRNLPGVRLNRADYDRMPGPSMVLQEPKQLPSLWSLISGLFGPSGP